MERLQVFHALIRPQLLISAFFVALGFVSLPASASGEFVVEPVALQGQAAPGTETGTLFAFTPTIYLPVIPTLDDDGRVGFAAMLQGPAVTTANRSGVWFGTPGAIELVARAGSQAPGMAPGVTFQSFPFEFALFSPPVASGRLVLTASLVGPGIEFTNDEGTWSHRNSSLALLIREGGAAPGLAPGVHFSSSLGIELSQSGHALLIGSVTGPGISTTNNEGFWSDRSGTMNVLFREGDPAPDTQSGVVFGGAGQFIGTGYSFGSVRWNPVAEQGLDGSITGPGVDTFDNEAIYVERNGSLHLLAREDGPAPGAGHNVDFGGNSVLADFSMLSFNAAGQAAFSARIGGSIPTTYALFSDHTGGLDAVALPGDPAPGTNDQFGILVDPVLSDGGRIAFRSALMGAGSYPPLGIWWDQPGPAGSLAALVIPGQTPTDRPGMTVVSAVRILGFNAAGTLAFQAVLADPQAGTRMAIVVAKPAGDLYVVVAAGDFFDVRGDGSDFRTVQEVALGGLNATGQMSLRLDFTDESFGFYRVSPSTASDLGDLVTRGGRARCIPNPFTAMTRLDFDVARSGRVGVDIFDVAGALVARLLDEPRVAGGHSVAWDGRDRSGALVPAGVYWAKIETAVGSRSVRLVRVPSR